MKKRILVLLVGVLLIGVNLFAADGDLIVEGNVGIGTTSPEAPLHIVQNGSSSANRNLIISQHINANQAGLIAFRRSRGTDGAPLALQNGDNVAWFDARPYDGNEYLFDAAHMEFIVSGNVSGNNVPMDFRIITGSSKQNYVPDFIIKNNGNVGIGTTNPGTYKLYVAGSAYATGTWQSSDISFKKDIKAIESPLDKILNIKGVSYSWKTNEYKEKGFDDGRHYGVIGQEIEKVMPEIVKEDPEGYKGVAYTELIPILIEAVKEQQKVIGTQQKAMQEQQKEMEALKTKVQKLETKDFTAKAQEGLR